MQIIAQHGDIFIILACLFGFFLSWLITLPAGAGLAIVFFFRHVRLIHLSPG